jgi:hypothetical protein
MNGARFPESLMPSAPTASASSARPAVGRARGANVRNPVPRVLPGRTEVVRQCETPPEAPMAHRVEIT